MLFDGWDGIGRVVVVGVLAYAAIVLMLRVSGNRTLSKMNAFDFVVTVALGSTLATILLSSDVALAEGVTAFALLIALQFAVTWLSVRFGPVRRLAASEPVLLLHQGERLPRAMRRARVTDDEVRAALREHGLADPMEAEAVVLETDGTVSVVRRADGAVPVLAGVRVTTDRD